ncbi:MAG: hypothetical protein KDE27_27150, partial [Planctomycetes bacterium]|nr:hypothetical protein [Planctomycetota bacterium]
ELRAAELHAVRQEYLVSGRSTLAREIVVPRGAGLEVELPPPVLRTGAVAGNAWLRGEPAGGAEVVLRPVDGVGAYVRRARVEAGGAFRIEDVPTGDFDAELRPEGAAEPAARQRCRVVAGAVAEVTLIAP